MDAGGHITFTKSRPNTTMPIISPLATDKLRIVEYQHFVETHYNVNSDKTLPTTRLSSKFDKQQKLHETSSRLKDGTEILKDVLTLITDDSASKKKKLNAARLIEQSILPLMSAAAGVAKESANAVGPMTGGDYAFKRNEVKRRKELKSLLKKNSVPMIQLVNAFVTQVTPTPSQSKRIIPKRAVNLSPGEYIPPMPLNGKVYGMGEFLSIIGEYRKGSNERGAMIRSIQSHGYLKVQKTAIYRCISQYEKGRRFNLLAPWPEHGRPVYVNDEEAEVIAERIRNNVGEKNTHDIVAEFVLEIVKKKGIVCDTINPRTIKNYMAYISTFPGVSLVDNSIPKTNNRWTAEHSDIAIIALMVVVAATHFYVVDEDDAKWNEYLDSVNNEDKEFFRMVSVAHGGRPVRAIHPWNIFNSDDTTDFIQRGKHIDKSKEIGLVSTASLHSSSQSSTYHKEDSTNMDGLRCKRFLLTNGVGETAPPVYCFGGLTDDEMPEEDFIVFQVEGLCIGGYGASSATGIGYVIFMKGTEGAEKKRFVWILHNVTLPFIKYSREEHGNLDRNDSISALADEHRAVYWLDGDTSQIAIITSPTSIQLFAENNITVNKHNASRTAKEQVNDLCEEFVVSKRLNKSTTIESSPCSVHRLKGSFTANLNQWRKTGKLILKKLKLCGLNGVNLNYMII